MLFKKLFLRATAGLITVVMLLYVGVCTHESYDVEDPQACLLHFSVLSDVHIEGNNAMRYKVFCNVLQDVQKNRSGNDVIAFLGDNTMNGHFLENLLFHGPVEVLLRGETLLPVLGNHDIGNGQGDYQKLLNRWYAFTEAFFGKHLENPYYYEVINGYYFIVLGTQAHSVNEMVMTDEQFAWLEQVLALAAESERPAFVFSHHPTSSAADINKQQTRRLIRILFDYNREHDLFCFVGHTHMTFTQSDSFRTRYGYAETYLPSLTHLVGEKCNEPDEETGVGVEVEVYADEVVIRARSFFYGEWLLNEDGETPCAATFSLKNVQTQEGDA